MRRTHLNIPQTRSLSLLQLVFVQAPIHAKSFEAVGQFQSAMVSLMLAERATSIAEHLA